jgi:hypothetical protein
MPRASRWLQSPGTPAPRHLAPLAALALGRSSSLVRLRTEEHPLFVDFLFKASQDRIFAEDGGMLIGAADGERLGAINITGDSQGRDEELAAYGIRAAGLMTDEDCAGLDHHVRLKNREARRRKITVPVPAADAASPAARSSHRS